MTFDIIKGDYTKFTMTIKSADRGPTDIRIRFAHSAERAALEELQRRASLVFDDYRAALSTHPESIQLPVRQLEEYRVRVAESSLEPVGFSVLLPQINGTKELDGLFVEPTHWRMGIGRLLMKDAVDIARLQNISAIEVIANPSAEGFYANFGFISLGHAQTQFGNATRMRYLVT